MTRAPELGACLAPQPGLLVCNHFTTKQCGAIAQQGSLRSGCCSHMGTCVLRVRRQLRCRLGHITPLCDVVGDAITIRANCTMQWNCPNSPHSRVIIGNSATPLCHRLRPNTGAVFASECGGSPSFPDSTNEVLGQEGSVRQTGESSLRVQDGRPSHTLVDDIISSASNTRLHLSYRRSL